MTTTQHNLAARIYADLVARKRANSLGVSESQQMENLELYASFALLAAEVFFRVAPEPPEVGWLPIDPVAELKRANSAEVYDNANDLGSATLDMER